MCVCVCVFKKSENFRLFTELTATINTSSLSAQVWKSITAHVLAKINYDEHKHMKIDPFHETDSYDEDLVKTEILNVLKAISIIDFHCTYIYT